MMTKQISKLLLGALYILLFVCLAVLAYRMVAKHTRENFQVDTGTSSRSLYKISKSFDNDVSSLSTVLTDADDSLLMAGCYQFGPEKQPNEYLPQDCYVSTFGIYTNTFDDVRDTVLMTLQGIATNNLKTKISGDAYVVVSQSPYMRDSNGNVITTQYNISTYNFEPKVGPNLSETQLFMRVYLILPLYDRNLKRKATSTGVPSIFNSFRTNKDQCFVKCVNDNTNSYCGCLNTTKDPKQSLSYTSSCSSTPDLAGDTNKSKNVPANFFIMYRVNPLSTIVAASNIFDR